MRERERKKKQRTDNRWVGKLVEELMHIELTPLRTESLTNLSLFLYLG